MAPTIGGTNYVVRQLPPPSGRFWSQSTLARNYIAFQAASSLCIPQSRGFAMLTDYSDLEPSLPLRRDFNPSVALRFPDVMDNIIGPPSFPSVSFLSFRAGTEKPRREYDHVRLLSAVVRLYTPALSLPQGNPHFLPVRHITVLSPLAVFCSWLVSSPGNYHMTFDTT